MTSKIGYLTFDCSNPATMAEFWSQVLGYENKGGDENWTSIRDPGGSGTPMLSQRVAEGKAVTLAPASFVTIQRSACV
jgi:Glyoxalase-like domain